MNERVDLLGDLECRKCPPRILLYRRNRNCPLLVMQCGLDRLVAAYCKQRTANLRDQIPANLLDSMDFSYTWVNKGIAAWI